MKEIDFLPSWYKENMKRQVSRRTQCILLVAIFVLIMIWNFATVSSVSTANAEVQSLEDRLQDAKKISEQYSGLQQEINQLKFKVNIVERIDSHIDIAATLAEISYLMSDRIVLDKIILKSEDISDKLSKGNAIRSASNPLKAKMEGMPVKSKFKMIISGVACDAINVAELIVKLENSPYFTQVIPSYSRNKQITDKAANSAKQYQVSEFEISCYLDNYEEKNSQNPLKIDSGQGNL